MVVIRGLHNPATACHVTSPLLLLAYALRPLSRGLQAASTTRPQDALLRAWAAVLRELWLEEEDAPDHAVYPQELYTQIQEASGGIRIHELGDATTSLVKLLSLLGQRPRDDEEGTRSLLLSELVEKALFSGRCSSVLTGISYDRTKQTCRQRTKRTPEKALATLFRMRPTGDDDDDEDLIQALDQALTAQVVHGYQWSGSYDAVTLPWDGVPPLADDDWYTTRQLQIRSLPPFWLIHVDHFVSLQGRVRPRYQTCRIPLTLDTARLLAVVGGGDEPTEDGLYRLNGAILHVSNRVDNVQDEEEEDGHYVVIVQSVRGGEGSWTMVDDDSTTDISQETCLSLLAGCDSSLSDHGTYIQACILLYESSDASQVVDPIVQNLERQAEQIKNNGQSLVGRRLRVLWGKGKYYTGVVTAFDATMGKHTVQYTDGDVRTYRLSKKTVRWLDDVEEASASP